MGVAEAYTPSQDIYLQLFMKYRCMGMSMRNVTLHELHQHGIHMAAYQASSLPKAGYYYLSLAQTRTLNEGDALIYNLITGHGVLIQNKAAVQAPSDYNKIAG